MFLSARTYYTVSLTAFIGFQLLSSLDDGFGSLGSQLLYSLSDEFRKSARYCLPFLPPLGPSHSFDTFSTRLTLALNLSDWLEHASMLTPLSSSPPALPFLSHQSLPHQTAAVLAAAVDTCSLIYRIPESGLDLQDYTSLLTQSGRKLTSISTLLPLPLLAGSSLQHSLSLHPLSSGACLTPSLHPSAGPIAACSVARGIPPSYRLFEIGASSYDSYTSLSDVISHEFGSRYKACASFSMLANSPLPLRHPFPRMFSSEVTPNGLVTSHKSSSSIQGNSIVNSVSCRVNVIGCIRNKSLLSLHITKCYWSCLKNLFLRMYTYFIPSYLHIIVVSTKSRLKFPSIV